MLLTDSMEPTHASAEASTRELVAQGYVTEAMPRDTEGGVDPFVQQVVSAAAGRLFKHRRGRLEEYPIPDFFVSDGNGQLLLDLGCNWGRWSLAAAEEGYVTVGIDPSLEAVAAARRVARQLNRPANYVVADGRSLPFRQRTFDMVFSYSVLQHFSRGDVRRSLNECARVLGSEGEYLVQMPNRFGLVSLYHQLRRCFRRPSDFEVRYWDPRNLRETFREFFGQATLRVDGFFGLGVGAAQPEDVAVPYGVVVCASRFLSVLTAVVPALKYLADSLYIWGQCDHRVA